MIVLEEEEGGGGGGGGGGGERKSDYIVPGLKLTIVCDGWLGTIKRPCSNCMQFGQYRQHVPISHKACTDPSYNTHSA